MCACPINVKLEVELIPVVAQQLESIHADTKFSKNYIINCALMHDFGIPDMPLNDETTWGIDKKENQ